MDGRARGAADQDAGAPCHHTRGGERVDIADPASFVDRVVLHVAAHRESGGTARAGLPVTAALAAEDDRALGFDADRVDPGAEPAQLFDRAAERSAGTDRADQVVHVGAEVGEQFARQIPVACVVVRIVVLVRAICSGSGSRSRRRPVGVRPCSGCRRSRCSPKPIAHPSPSWLAIWPRKHGRRRRR